MRIDLTIMQLGALKRDLIDQFQDDELGWLDAIEGETDAFELVRKLLDGIEADEGDRAALTAQMDDRKARRDRCDARIAARRNTIASLMDTAALEKLPLPEATLSLRKLAPKPIVIDPAALPDSLCTFTRKPNLAAIKELDALPDGCSLDNGGVSLTIRRK